MNMTPQESIRNMFSPASFLEFILQPWRIPWNWGYYPRRIPLLLNHTQKEFLYFNLTPSEFHRFSTLLLKNSTVPRRVGVGGGEGLRIFNTIAHFEALLFHEVLHLNIAEIVLGDSFPGSLSQLSGNIIFSHLIVVIFRACSQVLLARLSLFLFFFVPLVILRTRETP